MSELLIRRIVETDSEAIWRMLEPVFRAGQTYTVDPSISREDALRFWCETPRATYIATADDETPLGTFYIKTNQAGGGDHVCNAGFITADEASGRGVGRAMGRKALIEARNFGYRAMQFNFVLASNLRALLLWRSLGFGIVGTIPDAFRHPYHGFVDAHVMYRHLGKDVDVA